MNERDETTTTRTTTTTTTTNEMDTPVVRDDAAPDKMGDTMARGDAKMAGAKTPAGSAAGMAANATGNVIGMTVNDAGGETIGTVAEYNEQEGYLVLMGGWLFAKNTRMPLDAIGDHGASGLYTTAGKDELLEQYGDEEDRRNAEEIANRARTAIPDQSMAESGTTPQLSDVNVPSEEEDTSNRTTPMGLNQ